MNIETVFNENHQAEVTVEIESRQIERNKRIVARKLSKNIKIPGFRPGKAPYHIILRYIEEPRIAEEALGMLVDEIYPKVITETDIKPYGPGKLEDIQFENNTIAKFLIPLKPEVDIGEYKNIRLSYKPPVITDDDVNKFINDLREVRANIKEVDRQVQASDFIRVSIQARDASDSGDDVKLIIDEENMTVVVKTQDTKEEESSKDWPFPGFSQSLIGLSKGESKTITYDYPDDHINDDFKGKEVEFTIVINEINARSLPDIDDDFAKQLGNYANVEELLQDTRNHLEEQSLDDYEADYNERILDNIIKTSSIKYPPDAIEDEVDVLVNRLKNRLENQGLDFETYLKTQEKDEAQLRDEFRPIAKTRVEQSLVMLEVSSLEGIEVSPEEVESEVEKTVKAVFSSMSELEARKMLTDDVMRGLASSALNNSMIRRTMNFLREIATGEIDEATTSDFVSNDKDTTADTQSSDENLQDDNGNNEDRVSGSSKKINREEVSETSKE